MANANFIVQNGINVGGASGASITADPTTGAVVIAPAPTAAVPNPTAVVFTTAGTVQTVATTSGVASSASVATANSASSTTFTTLSTGALTGTTGTGNITLTGNIIPSANVTYDLGSKAMQFHSAYIGPGTLYINGTAVLGASTTGTPSINISASAGQNLSIATNGGGVIQLDGGSAGGGYIQVKSPMQISAGSNITSSDGNAIQFSNQIGVDSLTSHSSNTNLTITAQGTGKIALNTDTIITGNLTVNGTTETINTTNLLVSDQYIQMNNGVTGTPTLDAGIRVTRGSSNNSVLKWTESLQAWQISSDNVTFNTINAAGSLTGTTLASGVTASSLTSVGTLTSLTVSGTINTQTVQPSANVTYNLGSTTAWYNSIYGTSTHALYADLAENYQADRAYAPGTVVMFGGDQEVTLADAATTRVAGVVSTNPAHLMNGGLTGANVVPLALQGRVPCNVIGPVKKGDMMVSAGHGFAVASAAPQVGQVIGKALYDYPGTSKAVIEVVVGRI